MAKDADLNVDKTKADQQWERYVFLRDNGHHDFSKKATKCNDFYLGDQWDAKDKAKLAAQRRPALTQNQILPVISTVVGEHLRNRAEIGFRARSAKNDAVAAVLGKVVRYISDANGLDWVRRSVFEDGIITSRGFYDVRMNFDDNIFGDVDITSPNPKNVLIDPDAEDYNPDTWNDVIVSKWWTPDEVSNTYGKANGDYLKSAMTSIFESNSYDRVEAERDRFGARSLYNVGTNGKEVPQQRCVRLIDRQYNVFEVVEHFVDPTTGDTRQIPSNWDRNRIAAVVQQWGLMVTKRPAKRVHWTVTAGDLVLFDKPSPYKHFTIVPFFPYFRHGQTMGMVENLIDPQSSLNKITSQELHVINSTANSGWKAKAGSLVNMTIEELAERGAETGLVVEVTDVDALEKIQPNQYPSGLDRVSYKAAEAIKTISLIGDTMTGQDRADVAAKAIMAKQARGSVPLAPVQDNLNLTDKLLAERILSCVQGFYSAPRVFNVISDPLTNDSEMVEVNSVDEATGAVLNDLTIGEYDIIVTSQPAREAFEDSQFEQALALKTEAGVQIPDEYLIKNSRLTDRGELIKNMQAAAQSPEAQEQAALQKRGAEAEVAKTEAEAGQKQADTKAKLAKAEATIADQARKIAELEHKMGAEDPNAQAAQREAELAQTQQRHEGEMQMQHERHALEQQRLDDQHTRDQLRADDQHEREQTRKDEVTAATVRAAAAKKPAARKPAPK